ncbi:LacI family DNA-binding transcriptional regulator [Denitrobaculum tricleocarpae]|nr:LacI family DNA-binding transcriptional regulator [Denitrobaculum tricleocarpae]
MADDVVEQDSSSRLQRSIISRPTMADVARLSGFSAMTVSRALKDGASVSAKTRERILEVIEEIGYVPDLSAGGLSSKRSGFVTALVPTINNSNFSDTACGLTDALSKRGLQLLLGYTDYSAAREEELVAAMLRRRPEGMILTGGFHTPRARHLLESAAIPIIETWDLPDNPIDQVVGFSNAEATGAMVRDLTARGYRNIGFIGGSSKRDTRGADRRAGYEAAMVELGLGEGHVITFGTPPISMEQGGQAIVQMIGQWPEVDAVICVSDLSAFGAIMECHRRGWAVPGRIAVAGFGDFEVSRCCWPSITTVTVNSYDIGKQAGELLLSTLDKIRSGAEIQAATQKIDFKVVAREST